MFVRQAGENLGRKDRQAYEHDRYPSEVRNMAYLTAKVDMSTHVSWQRNEVVPGLSVFVAGRRQQPALRNQGRFITAPD